MQSILRAIAGIRMSLWWHHIVAPLLGVWYVILLLGKDSPLATLSSFFWLAVSIIGTASLGYWINDWTDQEQDLQVGKNNATTSYSDIQKTLILFLLFLLALTPWFFLPRSILSFGLWGVLVLSFILYSVPPIRFKERAVWGILCDMSYGHLLPVWITIGTFTNEVQLSISRPQILVCQITLLLILKGLRNIIQHQLEDRKKDQLLQLNTFVKWLGPYRSALLISLFILPLEIMVLGTLLWFLHVGLGLFYLFFILTYAWRIWSWKFYRSKSIRQVFRLWFVLNDYYEASFPLTALILLIFQDPAFIFVGLVHLFIFPKTLDHWKWVWHSWLNLELWWELRKYIAFFLGCWGAGISVF